jgi:D-alanyl-D-alanine carboxypeptidase (penicillin-binding protein 5/6)
VTLYGYERRSASPAPLLLGLVIVIAFIIVLGAVQLTRGLPDADVQVTLPASSVLGTPRMPELPEGGAAVVSVVGLGTLGATPVDEPRPIASVTKVMTAYVILKDHPLQPGASGPVIEITQQDADRFWEMVAQDQSVQPVNAGAAMTQLQLLQGMLIPSANNYAEILARWDAGSIEAFVAQMNAEAQALGMVDTVYDDVSGFSSGSISTANDQLILAREAMANPVFASIVASPEVTLPVAGTVGNVNQLLGVGGIAGIKTGFTEEAGANLAFAAKREAAGKTIDVVGVVLGQPGYTEVFDATLAIVNSLNNGLQALRVVPAGQPVAVAEPAWGGKYDVVVSQDVTMVVWPGMTLETTVEIDGVSGSQKAGEQVGWLNVRLGEQEQRVPLTLSSDIESAGLIYKLTRF